MRAVELFAGIGGFRMAADQLGLSTVWANDSCSKACAVYRSQFGASELVEGDIRERIDEIPKHHVLTAGFPCQPFSAAGKKRGVSDPRGTLFNVVVDVVQRRRPKVFVLENVKRLLTMDRGSHFATILQSLASQGYWIEWRLLNASHFGLPQNRQRVFIIGVKRRNDEGRRAAAPQIRLASRLDLTSNALDAHHLRNVEAWTSIPAHGLRFPNWGMAADGLFFGSELRAFNDAMAPVFLRSVLEKSVSTHFDFTTSTLERIKSSKRVRRFVEGVEILSNQCGGARMGYTVFGINGMAPTLTSTASRHYERYQIGDTYRRLTNVEYARIQGFPDNHCSQASVYEQYSLFGNAVPPPMAAWAIKQALSRGILVDQLPKRQWQRKLFVDA